MCVLLFLLQPACRFHRLHSEDLMPVCGLTVSVDVSQFIVQVEQAPDAVLHRGHGPVSR